jgi:hypothetical protein
MFRSRGLAQAFDQGNTDGRHHKQAVNYRLPHHASFGIGRNLFAQRSRIDKGAQQVDRRNAYDRHRELNFEHAGIDVTEPLSG